MTESISSFSCRRLILRRILLLYSSCCISSSSVMVFYEFHFRHYPQESQPSRYLSRTCVLMLQSLHQVLSKTRERKVKTWAIVHEGSSCDKNLSIRYKYMPTRHKIYPFCSLIWYCINFTVTLVYFSRFKYLCRTLWRQHVVVKPP